MPAAVDQATAPCQQGDKVLGPVTRYVVAVAAHLASPDGANLCQMFLEESLTRRRVTYWDSLPAISQPGVRALGLVFEADRQVARALAPALACCEDLLWAMLEEIDILEPYERIYVPLADLIYAALEARHGKQEGL